MSIGIEEEGISFGVNTGTSRVSISSKVPLFSCKCKATFDGKTTTGGLNPSNIIFMVTEKNALVEIYQNATLTGMSWADVNSNSLTEWDSSATAVSGGTLLYSFYAATGSGDNSANIYKIVEGIKNPIKNGDSLTVAVTGLNGTTKVRAALNWHEIH